MYMCIGYTVRSGVLPGSGRGVFQIAHGVRTKDTACIMCGINAKPVSLCSPMLIRRYVFRRHCTLMICPHSQLLTGIVQMNRSRMLMFANIASIV